jgi:16S rRNA (cytidine1402-2'-O)-methyltransferase
LNARPGTLFVVATPIGNVDDLSPRARETLAQVHVVACEDTRHAGQLLTRLGISARLVSLHEHNEERRLPEILAGLRAGEDVALVSDAGTPLISDPGYRLLAAARAEGLPVSPIPGPCAAVAALSVAGLPTDRFHFEGFLPARSEARKARLEELRGRRETLVFYESVHRIVESLGDAAAVLGGERPAAVGRELTKLHETVYRGTLAELLVAVGADPSTLRGEYVIVAGGNVGSGPAPGELARVVAILAAELPPGQAAALAARLTGAPRREAYQMALGARGRPEGQDEGSGPDQDG